jgi:hypothetical protein
MFIGGARPPILLEHSLKCSHRYGQLFAMLEAGRNEYATHLGASCSLNGLVSQIFAESTLEAIELCWGPALFQQFGCSRTHSTPSCSNFGPKEVRVSRFTVLYQFARPGHR